MVHLKFAKRVDLMLNVPIIIKKNIKKAGGNFRRWWIYLWHRLTVVILSWAYTYLAGGGRGGFPGGSVAKKPRAIQELQEMWVRSPGQEDPLEEGMAIHSSILAWRIPWTVEPGGLQSMGSQSVGHDWSHLTHIIDLQGVNYGCRAKWVHYTYIFFLNILFYYGWS